MNRRILLILMVLAVPAGLASASQALADKANPSIPHQQPIIVQLEPESSSTAAKMQREQRGDND